MTVFFLKTFLVVVCDVRSKERFGTPETVKICTIIYKDDFK